jgi:predicted dehydrogenase
LTDLLHFRNPRRPERTCSSRVGHAGMGGRQRPVDSAMTLNHRGGNMKIAVLGLGFMGSTHLKALAGIPGADLIAVMSGNERKLTGDLSGIQGNLGGPGEKMDFGGVRKYRTVDEVLKDTDIEAVDICLPTHLHAPVAIAALRSGKHVFVEKPMALDGQAADEMVEEARRQGRVLMVAHVLRFFPSYRGLAELLRQGRVGPVRYAIFRRRTATPTWGPWELDKSQSGGGVFDLLIHDVDMCLHLFGLPVAVSATGHEALAKGIDTMVAQLEYPEIGSVAITGGWHHIGEYPFSMEFTVTGDHATAEYSSAGRPLTVYPSNGPAEVQQTDETDPYQAELDYFLDCADRGCRPDLCSPEESARAVKVTRLMVESREGKGERIKCDL